MSGPLEGLRVVELAGIGPCPFAGMVLADLGADVLRVERPSAVADAEPPGPSWDLLERGKRSIGVDLKHAAGVALLLELARTGGRPARGIPTRRRGASRRRAGRLPGT